MRLISPCDSEATHENIVKPESIPLSRLHQPYGQLTKESQRKGMITALDEAVKNVTRALKETDSFRDTAIIFLSDNGGASKGSRSNIMDWTCSHDKVVQFCYFSTFSVVTL